MIQINYINDSDLKEEHIRVVRLVNRIEARVRRRKNEGNDTIKTDPSILDEIHNKGKKIVGDAILKEADY